MSRLKSPDFGPDDELFPPLPTIRSKDTEIRVFTHRSLYGRPTHIFEDHPDDPSPDNEKLEHLGDSVLSLAVTDLMADAYPNLRVGPSTKVRALVVGNSNLASISVRYKLPDRLRLHPAQAVTLRNSAHVQADVFESFIGGLYVDQGLDAVKTWLTPLFLPYTAVAYRIVRQQHGLPASPTVTPKLSSDLPKSLSKGFSQLSLSSELSTGTIGHLALFNQHLQKQNKLVEWQYIDLASNAREQGSNGLSNFLQDGESVEDLSPGQKAEREYLLNAVKTTPMWSVKVNVNGELYGTGRGNTKKAARNEAAKQGLIKMGVLV